MNKLETRKRIISVLEKSEIDDRTTALFRYFFRDNEDAVWSSLLLEEGLSYILSSVDSDPYKLIEEYNDFLGEYSYTDSIKNFSVELVRTLHLLMKWQKPKWQWDSRKLSHIPSMTEAQKHLKSLLVE
jgi:hypothetical protein